MTSTVTSLPRNTGTSESTSLSDSERNTHQSAVEAVICLLARATMCAAQLTVALGVHWVMVCGCSSDAMKARDGLGGATEPGGSLASGGVLGSGGATGGAAGDGSAGIGSTGGTSGSGGASLADASATRDAKNSPDAPPLLCRPVPPCPAGWNYVDNDSACSFGGTTSICTPRGDGHCYQECKTDSDCTSPSFPTCGSIDVAAGSDYLSPKPVCLGSVGWCSDDAGSS